MPKPTMKNPNHNSDMQTPGWALDPLIPYINPVWEIWEPAAGSGNLVRAMKSAGFRAYGTDISQGHDFFECFRDFAYDAIITNPPYDQKDRWIGRMYLIGKPFALLLPIEALGGKFRQAMYRESGLQVVFFDRRVNFEVPSGKNAPWFPVAWFTWGFDLPKDMVFVEVERGKKNTGI